MYCTTVVQYTMYNVLYHGGIVYNVQCTVPRWFNVQKYFEKFNATSAAGLAVMNAGNGQ